MAVNKVEFGDQVVMDITDSTVSPEKLLSGETAYDRSGAKITGSLVTKDISIETKRSTGENVATISLDNTDYDIYALSEEEVADFLSGDQEAEGNPVTLKTLLGGNAKSCSVDLLPIQDSHGYDSPWVGGAGKNKFQTTATSQTVNGTVFTVNADGSVTIKNTPSSNISSYNFGVITLQAGTYKVNGFSGGASNNIRLNFRDNNSTTVYAIIYADRDIEFTLTEETDIRVYPIVPTTYDGNEVTMYPMIRLASVTDGTFAPYENICPISGRTEVSVTRTGTNQWDEQWESGSYRSADGTPSVDASRIRSKNRVEVLSDSMYLVTLTSTIIFLYDATDTYLGYKSVNGNGIITPITWYANAKYIRFSVGSSINPVTTYTSGIAINYPSSVTAYEPYRGETVTVSFGQTVYGGTLDITNGKLTIDTAFQQTTWGDMGTGTSLGNNVRKSLSLSATGSRDLRFNSICNIAPYKEGSFAEDTNKFMMDTLATKMYVYAPSTTDSTQSVQIGYPLATPIELTLTPEEISLLKGNNVISTDGDNIDITWQNIPDIEKLIGNTIEGTLTTGSTSLTLQNDKITEDSTFDIYTDKYGVNPTDITVTNGQAVLTFESQLTDLKVKVKVM